MNTLTSGGVRIRRSIPGRTRLATTDSRQSGLGMVEVFMAGTVLALGMAGYVTAALSSQSLQSEARARTQALQLARGAVETMRSMPFEDVFPTFNEDPDDDPLGTGTAIGDSFDSRLLSTVEALTSIVSPSPVAEDHRAYRTSIKFPVDPVTRSALREDLASTDWPNLDLNADGVIDGASHASDYVVLPVRVRVDWESSRGTRSIQLEALITRR
ncbi:MAG: hypothetical protein H6834_16605 [Planctomycetes bacterium]|nr:hypothetical protein [Planctomycetota bacterium]